MAPFRDSMLQLVSPSFLAAAALVCVQVGMGVLFKAVQNHGHYPFSISSSVAISEFFKFWISAVFFYQSCRQRVRNQDDYISLHEASEPLKEGASSQRQPLVVDGSSKGLLEDGQHQEEEEGVSLEELERPAWNSQRLTLSLFLKHCKEELNRQTIIGYGHLALLYATINNTVFVLFELADPGTISLIKSGITLITALVLMLTLGTKIAKLQWIAIALQVCGLIVTQYHPGTGSVYPIYTYAILGFQTFCSAVAGVYNQHLLKSQDSSMHAQNMALYTFGMCINTVVHFIISTIKSDEPGFFHGFNQIGPILVIVSSVLNGLVITAVYKYADALIKCFATAFSTAILLYISPIAFGADFSFLIFPGTATVFTATWLYMDSAPPKAAPPPADATQPCPMDEKTGSSDSSRGVFSALAPTGVLGQLGLIITTCLAISGIAGLHAWDSAAPPSTPVSDAVRSGPITSPFQNTFAMVRYNALERMDRFPLLEKYRPFFHTLHFSIPKIESLPDTPADPTIAVAAGLNPPTPFFSNRTHDAWIDGLYPYNAAARSMQQILDASPPPSSSSPPNASNAIGTDPASTTSNTSVATADDNPTWGANITGLLYFHFDMWLNPFEFPASAMDYNRTWLPDAPNPPYRCYTDPREGESWGAYRAQHVPEQLPKAMAALDAANTNDNDDGDGSGRAKGGRKYSINPHLLCQGWSDMFYIPRRYFADWIYLSAIMDSYRVFHEAAIPTMLNVLDATYGVEGGGSIIQRVGDCWGHCCAGGAKKEDIEWRRCGHHLDYGHEEGLEVAGYQYQRLERQREMLGGVVQGIEGGEGAGKEPKERMRNKRDVFASLMELSL
ncbi:uncharacterized protein HMPREF1541_03411 [Cyphellophora europaea CBS 101466]|uniref:UDP-galactose transporter n=1 Tax=Cyphellophora europaea (strain CBS 101466) TaxID=1220924 RepID=W2RYS3_CYPE1|nr:uncharacterized protein HMPREF1541_03411 [Cyphellophora europaea CBS 101466]ETN41475.1 hypothetical protein HMPREF1541_03411 [Cyphellophora europaea CBS 101466]